MRNQSWEEERSFKTEHSDLCLNIDCSVVLIGAMLVLFIVTVLVLAAVLRRWKMKKREKKTQKCLETVEMEFQFLGSLYEASSIL
jgi:F0F1-type ATP synthase membrane subunit a